MNPFLPACLPPSLTFLTNTFLTYTPTYSLTPPPTSPFLCLPSCPMGQNRKFLPYALGTGRRLTHTPCAHARLAMAAIHTQLLP